MDMTIRDGRGKKPASGSIGRSLRASPRHGLNHQPIAKSSEHWIVRSLARQAPLIRPRCLVCREPIRRLICCLGWVRCRQALGGKESGGKTAVPIVKAYVAAAEMDGPAWPPPPEGVVTRLISQSDRLAQKGSRGSWEEIFLSGTEPVEYAVADGELDRMDFHFDRDETEEKEKEEPKVEAPDEDAIDKPHSLRSGYR